MTTSISSGPAESPDQKLLATPRHTTPERWAKAEATHTFASRFVFLILCVAIVLTTLAYGTVHYWSLAVFTLGAAVIVTLWVADGWRLRSLRISRNLLQLPLIGTFALGLVQLLPLGRADTAGLPVSPVRSLSADPYSTQLFLVQIAALLIYFSATLVFVDTPHRLRLLVRTITIFGFLLAMFGLTQSLISSPTKIYWIRELPQSTAFGPFINRHHFAGYMELAMAIPLGLLFSGVIEREKRLLYIFAVTLMGVALVMTNSRGGIISLAAELFFLVVITSVGSKRTRHALDTKARAFAAIKRLALAFAMVMALMGGVVFLGGASVFTRFLGTVNAEDPTTGRTHFWAVTADIIKHHPIVGAGLGAYSVLYPRYDSRNGLFRLEQAHNDYLQVLADGGVVGAALGLFFIISLFGNGFARRETRDDFRRGVSTGALAGCFAVLVHSFFDFTLHTTSNALLFLVIAGLATMDARVERGGRRRKRQSSPSKTEVEPGDSQLSASLVTTA